MPELLASHCRELKAAPFSRLVAELMSAAAITIRFADTRFAFAKMILPEADESQAAVTVLRHYVFLALRSRLFHCRH